MNDHPETSPGSASEMDSPARFLVLVPTHIPREDDPRDISVRAAARIKAAAELVRSMREEHGRANVLLGIVGGWALHRRLPLALHHALAAIDREQILDADELDLIMGYGVNTVTDFHETLVWANQYLPDITEAMVVTSRGHARRLIAEAAMHTHFDAITHVESGEPRAAGEDEEWEERAVERPPHQYVVGGRASDVSRFGTRDALDWEIRMGHWADEHPEQFEQYLLQVWDLVRRCEAANTVIRIQGGGGWRLSVNCY